MGKTLVIMGAGFLGKQVLKDSRVSEDIYENIYFFDNDTRKIGQSIEGIKVISESELLELLKSNEMGIIIATDLWKDLYQQCCKLRVEEKVIEIVNKRTIERMNYINKSFSQDGEDIFLSNYFINKKGGFYVDIGAHHPLRFSNTAWAYRLGWNGINIEPNEDKIEIFNRLRPNDINLQVGCAGENGILKYYKYEEAALNNFNKEVYKNLLPIETKEVIVKTLPSILEENNVTHIDFMNVDTEGKELEILESNNWNIWKPTAVCVEELCTSVEDIMEGEIYKFMSSLGYKLGCQTRLNSIYIK